MAEKTITLSDILTPVEYDKVASWWPTMEGREFRKKVRDEMIIPNIARINERVGQENDADFLSYVVEYVFQSVVSK